MIAILEQQVRENYEKVLNEPTTTDRGTTNFSFDSIGTCSVLDKLWNFYLDFCFERLTQATESNRSEVKTKRNLKKEMIVFSHCVFQHASICDQVFSSCNQQVSLTVEQFHQWVSFHVKRPQTSKRLRLKEIRTSLRLFSIPEQIERHKSVVPSCIYRLDFVCRCGSSEFRDQNGDRKTSQCRVVVEKTFQSVD